MSEQMHDSRDERLHAINNHLQNVVFTISLLQQRAEESRDDKSQFLLAKLEESTDSLLELVLENENVPLNATA